MPWAFLCVAVIAVIAILIPQQMKLARNHHALRLMQAKNYKGLTAFLSKHSPEDFNKVQRLPPDPYEYWGLTELPKVVSALDGTETVWVRQLYLDYLDVALQHKHMGFSPSMVPSIGSVLRLPDGEKWIVARATRIEALFNAEYPEDRAHPEMQELAQHLNALGLKVTVTVNVAKPNP